MKDKLHDDNKKGQLDTYGYNAIVLKFQSKHEHAYLNKLHQLSMKSVISPQRRPEGYKASQRHKDAGHALVGITATSDFITAPIFREFGITEIIATNAEVLDGKYTGKVINTACYQQGKLVRLEQWLQGRDVTESWAYSDSINDRFLLEYADHAIAVNPD